MSRTCLTDNFVLRHIEETTGSTYGEITAYIKDRGVIPKVFASTINSEYVAVINNITNTMAQVIIRRVADGGAVLNKKVKVDMLICY